VLQVVASWLYAWCRQELFNDLGVEALVKSEAQLKWEEEERNMKLIRPLVRADA
jgi:hypothetical protein